MPAAGAMVEAIRIPTGIHPVIVGKPFASMFQAAMKGLDASRAVMVGDNPETDILGAHQVGLPAIIVGSSFRRYPSTNDIRTADARIEHVLDLFDQDVTLKAWVRSEYSCTESIKSGVAGIVFDERGYVLLLIPLILFGSY